VLIQYADSWAWNERAVGIKCTMKRNVDTSRHSTSLVPDMCC